jgi:two-component system chemotaxis response regulator CheB
MPPVFTRSLAERLDAGSALTVREAENGSIIRSGQVFIAPGNYHLTLETTLAGPKAVLNQDAPENSCRPSADVLFRSAASEYGSSVLAVVLTGMGCDGLEGARAIVRARGTVLAQDEASAVVASMPKAIAKAGLATATIPIEALAGELVRRATSPLLERRARS